MSQMLISLSLRSKLSERQNDCADSTVQCVRQALQNIQSWNQMAHANPPSSSATSMQVCLCLNLHTVNEYTTTHHTCLIQYMSI